MVQWFDSGWRYRQRRSPGSPHSLSAMALIKNIPCACTDEVGFKKLLAVWKKKRRIICIFFICSHNCPDNYGALCTVETVRCESRLCINVQASALEEPLAFWVVKCGCFRPPFFCCCWTRGLEKRKTQKCNPGCSPEKAVLQLTVTHTDKRTQTRTGKGEKKRKTQHRQNCSILPSLHSTGPPLPLEPCSASGATFDGLLSGT